jgi:branched-chain amino acid transport system substrate-binding protein
MFRSTTTRWRRSATRGVPVIAAIAALGLSACGSSSNSSNHGASSAGSGAGSSSSGPTVQTTNGSYPYTSLAKYMYGNNWAKYVGNDGLKKTKADPSKAPVVLGWLNTESGTSARPYLTKLADMSVYMINDVLGGIGGHPVQLKKCFIQSNEADGQTCAQQFANDPTIKAVVVGADIIGGTSFQATMKGAKPIIAGAAVGPYDIGAKNTIGIEGSRLVAGTLMNYFSQTGKKNVAYITANNPLLVAAFNQAKSQVKQYKMNLKLTPVYYDPTATDITPTIIAANLKQYDAIYFVSPSAALCIPVIKALAAQGITGSKTEIVPSTACFDPAVNKAVGDLPKWDYFFYGPLIFAPFKASDEVASFVQAAKDTNETAAIQAEPSTGPVVVSQFMLAAKLFNQIGYSNLSVAKVGAELPKFTGHPFMGAPQLQYNTFPGLPNIGAVGFYLYHYGGNSKYTPLAGAKWVSLPTSAG